MPQNLAELLPVLLTACCAGSIYMSVQPGGNEYFTALSFGNSGEHRTLAATWQLGGLAARQPRLSVAWQLGGLAATWQLGSPGCRLPGHLASAVRQALKQNSSQAA